MFGDGEVKDMSKISLLIIFLTLSNTALSQTISLRCKFSSGQVTEFDKGRLTTKRAGDLSEIIFDQIDLKKQSARMIGNAGAETLPVIEGTSSVHLLEVTGTGNLNVTTIFGIKNAKENQFSVVHSRHITLSGGPLPSQYLGTCIRL